MMKPQLSRRAGYLLFPAVVAVATAAVPVVAQEKPSETKPYVDQTPKADAPAPAAEPAKPAEPPKPNMTAKLVPELGLVITGGNTKTKSINGAATGNLTAGAFSLDAYFKALYAESRVYEPAPSFKPKTDTTASKYEMGTKPAYNVTDRMYVFGTFDYVDDKFSGFDWTATETGGLGVKVINEKNVTLKFEGGPGGKHTRTLPAGGPPPVQVRNDDFIGRGAISFLWKITDTSSLGEEANTIFGPKSTGGIVTDATTSLQSQIIGKLSLKASFNIHFVTDPPPVDPDGDTVFHPAKDIDTKTALNFVYTVNWDDVAGLNL